jgi:hypothetical protein
VPCSFGGNYRKAAVWIWYHEFTGTYFAGFFTKYFWKTAPGMFGTLLLAEKAGLFDQTVVDAFSGAGNNSWEDVSKILEFTNHKNNTIELTLRHSFENNINKVCKIYFRSTILLSLVSFLIAYPSLLSKIHNITFHLSTSKFYHT